jgi:hypothetical protein
MSGNDEAGKLRDFLNSLNAPMTEDEARKEAQRTIDFLVNEPIDYGPCIGLRFLYRLPLGRIIALRDMLPETLAEVAAGLRLQGEHEHADRLERYGALYGHLPADQRPKG